MSGPWSAPRQKPIDEVEEDELATAGCIPLSNDLGIASSDSFKHRRMLQLPIPGF